MEISRLIKFERKVNKQLWNVSLKTLEAVHNEGIILSYKKCVKSELSYQINIFFSELTTWNQSRSRKQFNMQQTNETLIRSHFLNVCIKLLEKYYFICLVYTLFNFYLSCLFRVVLCFIYFICNCIIVTRYLFCIYEDSLVAFNIYYWST